jgi:Nitrile hydratase beta subunit
VDFGFPGQEMPLGLWQQCRDDLEKKPNKEDAHHLYTVRFTARELWGESANPRDTVCVDLWDDYLEAA